jgi:predicted PurR-regulated permease PerM
VVRVARPGRAGAQPSADPPGRQRHLDGGGRGYVTGNLLISVIAGTVTTLTLLALSVPYAVALGVIVAIFDLVPLVGATAGTVVVAAVALGTHGFAAASIAVVVMIVYQ